MSKIAKNIRVLRGIKKISQEQLAAELDIPRSRIGSYEEGRAEPSCSFLIQLSDFFHVSIDALIRGDLSKTDPDSMMKIGKNRTLFPVQVDKENKDLVEVVPVKAIAGYLNGYADPEFIEELPVMTLPFQLKGKHRAFTIKGDSMPPLKDGSVIVGSFIESVHELKNGQTYIFLTKEEGLVYKRLYQIKNKSTVFELHSDNKNYLPYKIEATSVLEIWSFVCCINMGEFKPQEMDVEQMIDYLKEKLKK
ncbi:MAG TPA: helix-turn-helix domain-containing protein [Bacteroidia bacterium]|nr:helix-turn-helix domain-containing protein [Bacteroidia bacterium]